MSWIQNYLKNIFFTFLIVYSIFGCSIFLGNIKPILKKSTHYSVMNLSTYDASWIAESNVETEFGFFDLIYQSKKTGSIISLNSLCFDSTDDPRLKKTLQELLQETLQVFPYPTIEKQSTRWISSQEGIQTILSTSISSQNKMKLLKINSVILIEKNCQYDLMLIAKDEYYKIDERIFNEFLLSFEIK